LWSNEKRPGIRLGPEQLAHINNYVYALDGHYGRMSDASQQRRVEGLLVGSEIRPEHRTQFADARSRIAVRTEQHNEFLDVIERRVAVPEVSSGRS
jgi:hypothetical protein